MYSMGDKKAGIKQQVLSIKDKLAIIHKVVSNPKSSHVTSVKELGTLILHNVKEIRKFV
jgi:uncharacterized protein YlxP (DUF503 family)